MSGLIELAAIQGVMTGSFLAKQGRFMVEVLLDPGLKAVCHLHDTGRVDHILTSGSRVFVALRSGRLGRRTSCDLVAGLSKEGVLVLLDSRLPNKLFRRASTVLLGNISYIVGEPRLAGARLDFIVGRENEVYAVEVKGVNTAESGACLFPNARSLRAVKHLELLRSLHSMVGSPVRPLMVFVALRGDCSLVKPNRRVDPLFSTLLCNYSSHIEYRAFKVVATYRASEGGLHVFYGGEIPVEPCS